MPYFLFDDPHPGNWHNHFCYFSSSFLIMDICCLFTAVVFSSIRHIFIDVVIWHMISLLLNGLFLGSPSLLFSAVVYSSAFCQAFHKCNLIWWSVPIGGILRLSLGWANCGSVCAAYAHCAPTSYLAPDVKAPFTMMSLLTSSTILVWRPSIRRLIA